MDQEKHWFVAYVMACRERKVAEALGRLGYEYYLPLQRRVRQWSDRKKIIECLVLPRMIFVRCDEMARRRSLEEVPGMYRYITFGGPFKPAVIPDKEMETFRSMVENGGREVTILSEPFAPGDKVRVVTGPLAGCECELIAVGGRRCLAVKLGSLGTAKMGLDLDMVEKIV